MSRGVIASAFICIGARAALSIDSYGAVRGNNTYAAAVANGRALWLAMQAANGGSAGNDTRRVLIPASSAYYFLPYADILNVSSVTLHVDGALLARTDNRSQWPNQTDGSCLNMISFVDATDLAIVGNGVVEGQGDAWWVAVLEGEHDHRPNLLTATRCIRCTFSGITFRNSPQYHVLLTDVLHVTVNSLTVYVDVDGQVAMLRRHGYLEDGRSVGPAANVTTFPLNTDGIDVSGRNITITNATVTNFDDALCVKPLSGSDVLSQCSEAIVIKDSRVFLGVGLSVGSVRPSATINCVRNVTFTNITLTSPIKGIHVKPNPGTVGTGVIDDITYENITATDPLWWGIFVNPQQQVQPGGGTNTGCDFLFPLPNTTCPTQPRVPVTRLTLRNIYVTGALLSPGLLRCNSTGPCSGWRFENVNVTSSTNWPAGPAFYCSEKGSIVNSTWLNVVPPLDDCFGVPADSGA